MTARRFPPPWSIEELNSACFVVRDHNGQKLAYVYHEDEPQRQAVAKLLTKDEARRIAVAINLQHLAQKCAVLCADYLVKSHCLHCALCFQS